MYRVLNYYCKPWSDKNRKQKGFLLNYARNIEIINYIYARNIEIGKTFYVIAENE